MGKFWMKIWLWIKVIAFALVLIYVIAFALINCKDVTIWISYKKEIATNTLVLAMVAFIAGVVCTVLIRTSVVTLKQYREIKERNRRDKLTRDVEELKARTVLPTVQSNSLGDSDVKT